MRDLEKERCKDRSTFGFGAHHALRDVTATARFASGIPRCPPLQADIGKKGCKGDAEGFHCPSRVTADARQHVPNRIVGSKLLLESVNATDFIRIQDQNCQDNASAHRQDKLKRIGHRDAHESADTTIDTDNRHGSGGVPKGFRRRKIEKFLQNG